MAEDVDGKSVSQVDKQSVSVGLVTGLWPIGDEVCIHLKNQATICSAYAMMKAP